MSPESSATALRWLAFNANERNTLASCLRDSIRLLQDHQAYLLRPGAIASNVDIALIGYGLSLRQSLLQELENI